VIINFLFVLGIALQHLNLIKNGMLCPKFFVEENFNPFKGNFVILRDIFDFGALFD
jgi:hypothetical protein